jgi:hypothetical protein
VFYNRAGNTLTVWFGDPAARAPAEKSALPGALFAKIRTRVYLTFTSNLCTMFAVGRTDDPSCVCRRQRRAL